MPHLAARSVLLLLVATPTYAEWLFFTPCGFVLPPEHEVMADTAVAPSYSGFWVRKESIEAIVEYRRQPGAKGPACSYIIIGPGQIRAVVGSGREILDTLEKTDE